MKRNDHLEAVIALINARYRSLATPRTAYTPRLAAVSEDRDYTTVILTRRYGGNLREGGPLSPSGWRLAVRAVGLSDENVRVMLDAAEQALEDHTITVGGDTSTPIAFESEDAVRQDDADRNVWSGQTRWTYAF